MKPWKVGLYLCLLLLMTAAAASGLEVTDALGRTLFFEQPPERIVVAGRGLVMVADALYLFPEARSRVVAVEKITLGSGCFLPVVDPTFSEKIELPIEVGVEPILFLKPDVVLMKSYMRQKLGGSLEALNVPVVYLDFETPEQYARDLLVLGALLQNRARAEYLVSGFRDRVLQVEQRLPALPERPRVLFLYYSEQGGGRAFNVPPASWMQTILVERAGGIPVWKDKRIGQGWNRVGFEQIAAWDADYIFVTSYFTDVDEVKERLLADPLWVPLRAVRENRFYAFPTDYYSWDMPSSRWILGLTWLAGKLYPERFSDVDMNAEMRTFFRDLYFIDDEAYGLHIRTMLGGDLP
jgi:iron complex transport system substrate-binding protein